MISIRLISVKPGRIWWGRRCAMTLIAGKTALARIVAKWQARRTLGALLSRMDDHLLDDIGLTRDEVRRALSLPEARYPSAASQRAQVPGCAWVPTSGRIFQQRSHFAPSAFSNTTPTPGTSVRRNASCGAGSLVI